MFLKRSVYPAAMIGLGLGALATVGLYKGGVLRPAKAQLATEWTLTYGGAFGMGHSLTTHPRIYPTKEECMEARQLWLNFVPTLPNEEQQFPGTFPAEVMCWESLKPSNV